MREKILVTSALLYSNGPLHFGHIAGAYLPADCFVRYQRLMKRDVLWISGSDEYGFAITMAADLAKRTPREHVDIFHAINKELFQKLDISFDHYSRTTWEGHAAPVQAYFNDLLANGYIAEKVTNQLYSEADGKFLADRYVVGTCPKCGYDKARGDECPECGASFESTDLKNPRSKLTNSPLTLKPTKHWFLLLDKFKEKLISWLEAKSWKSNVVNFVKGYIQDLHPRAITRDSTWGIPIPLPGTEGKVLYVWFDAPIGYISATMEWAQLQGSPERWKDYWHDPKTRLVHFIGKDNIPFHAAIFPAMTMGQNQPYKLVDDLPANEFLRLEGRQFSKSDNWYIDLEEFLTRYTADQIRYYLAANAPETADSEFTWKEFQLRCNGDLLGKYGNFVNRVLVFAKNQCGQKVPLRHSLETIDEEFLSNIRALADQAAQAYEGYKVRRAAQLVMEIAQLGNVYFDTKKPWSDAKSEATRARMETTIACCIECIKLMALVSAPIVPEAAGKIAEMVEIESWMKDLSWNEIKEKQIEAGHLLREPKILFTKIEDEQIAKEIETLYKNAPAAPAAPTQAAAYQELKAPVDIDDVRKIDLRVGVVLEAAPVPKSKKLLKIQVDLGFEKRSILAGISQFYTPEQLVGKKVIVVANLKPATLMGIESQGMILAGSWDNTLETPAVLDLPPGSAVS